MKRILLNVSHLNVIFVLSTYSNRALDSPFAQGFVHMCSELPSALGHLQLQKTFGSSLK